MPIGIVPLNSTQKMQEIPINAESILQPTTHYTCPVGKRAKVTGQASGRLTGAGTAVYLKFGGINYCAWTNNGVDPNSITSRPLNVPKDVDVVLEAGDTIETAQNAGTNAEIILFLKVLELPA